MEITDQEVLDFLNDNLISKTIYYDKEHSSGYVKAEEECENENIKREFCISFENDESPIMAIKEIIKLLKKTN